MTQENIYGKFLKYKKLKNGKFVALVEPQGSTSLQILVFDDWEIIECNSTFMWYPFSSNKKIKETKRRARLEYNRMKTLLLQGEFE